MLHDFFDWLSFFFENYFSECSRLAALIVLSGNSCYWTPVKFCLTCSNATSYNSNAPITIMDDWSVFFPQCVGTESSPLQPNSVQFGLAANRKHPDCSNYGIFHKTFYNWYMYICAYMYHSAKSIKLKMYSRGFLRWLH